MRSSNPSLEDLMRNELGTWVISPHTPSEEVLRLILSRCWPLSANGLPCQTFYLKTNQLQTFFSERLAPSCLHGEAGRWQVLIYDAIYGHYTALDLLMTAEGQRYAFYIDYLFTDELRFFNSKIKGPLSQYQFRSFTVTTKNYLQHDGYSCATFALAALREVANIPYFYEYVASSHPDTSFLTWSDLPMPLYWMAQSLSFLWREADKLPPESLVGVQGIFNTTLERLIGRTAVVMPADQRVQSNVIGEYTNYFASQAALYLDQMTTAASPSSAFFVQTESDLNLIEIIYAPYPRLVSMLTQCVQVTQGQGSHPLFAEIFSKISEFVDLLNHPIIALLLQDPAFLTMIYVETFDMQDLMDTFYWVQKRIVKKALSSELELFLKDQVPLENRWDFLQAMRGAFSQEHLNHMSKMSRSDLTQCLREMLLGCCIGMESGSPVIQTSGRLGEGF